jgi:DNA-binding phage protein
MKKLRTWHEFLIEQLADREEAIGYLQVSLEEYLVDGDTSFFLKGIQNVVEAQGGVSEVAKQADIAPETLSKFLCSEDPLQLGTFSAILKALGWRLSIQPLTIEDHGADIPNSELTTVDETRQTGSEQTAESRSA